MQVRLFLEVFKLRRPRLLSSLIVEDMGDQLTSDIIVRRGTQTYDASGLAVVTFVHPSSLKPASSILHTVE